MTLREIPGVQKPTVAYAKNLGWKLCWKMRIEGKNGCPDYWFLRRGVWVIIEFKAEDGEVSAQQERRIEELREGGQAVHIIRSAEAGRALFDSME